METSADPDEATEKGYSSMRARLHAWDEHGEKWEYWWSLLAAVILSLATLASAWCGFQASAWGSVYAQESRAANGERFTAARQSEIADRQLTSDLLIFTTWVEADVRGDKELADELEARFLPQFRPAFDAWAAQPLEEGSMLPPGSPFDQPQYEWSTQMELDAANARVTKALDAADLANEISSRYVLTSVLFASVLFLAGIASRLPRKHLSHGVLTVAAVAMLLALVLLISSPMQM